jgi:alpha-1,2-mannosyltransferase
MYGPSPATAIPVGSGEREFWNMNPPHFHLLILPLAVLSRLTAVLAWSTLSLAAAVTAAALIARELRIEWRASAIVWAVVLLVVVSATGQVVVTGQITFFLLLGVTWSWIAARSGRWSGAGAVLGALASVKPFIGIFLVYLLVMRRWRAAFHMMAASAACFAAGVMVFGVDSYGRWLSVLTAVDWAWAPMNASVAGIAARTFDASPLFKPVWHAPQFGMALTLLATATVLIVAILQLRRDHSPSAVDRAYAVLVVVSLLVSPLGWWYYIWIAAGPLAALWLTREERPSNARDLMLVPVVPGLILPLYVTSGFRHLAWTTPTLASLYGWTLLWLFGSLVADSLASRRTRRDWRPSSSPSG